MNKDGKWFLIEKSECSSTLRTLYCTMFILIRWWCRNRFFCHKIKRKQKKKTNRIKISQKLKFSSFLFKDLLFVQRPTVNGLKSRHLFDGIERIQAVSYCLSVWHFGCTLASLLVLASRFIQFGFRICRKKIINKICFKIKIFEKLSLKFVFVSWQIQRKWNLLERTPIIVKHKANPKKVSCDPNRKSCCGTVWTKFCMRKR